MSRRTTSDPASNNWSPDEQDYKLLEKPEFIRYTTEKELHAIIDHAIPTGSHYFGVSTEASDYDYIISRNPYDVQNKSNTEKPFLHVQRNLGYGEFGNFKCYMEDGRRYHLIAPNKPSTLYGWKYANKRIKELCDFSAAFKEMINCKKIRALIFEEYKKHAIKRFKEDKVKQKRAK